MGYGLAEKFSKNERTIHIVIKITMCARKTIKCLILEYTSWLYAYNCSNCDKSIKFGGVVF